MASSSTRSRRRTLFAAVLTLGLTACAPLYTSDAELSAPRSLDDWTTLVQDVRLFQRRIGFEPTRNFRRVDGSAEGYAFCGHASPFYLPYSYQDPAIRWVDARTERECQETAEDAEASFATTEAVAGRETPVNGKVLVAPLARVLYVIMHEDCHEQFQLPSGIEEALCNVLAYAAMEQLAEERFSGTPHDYGSIRLFARAGAARAQFTRELYEEVAALYAQHDNALICNLARTVAFFKRLDAAKAARQSSAVNRRGAGQDGFSFVRAYEKAIAEVIERSLEVGDMLDRELPLTTR